jgi:hypothetical protein
MIRLRVLNISFPTWSRKLKKLNSVALVHKQTIPRADHMKSDEQIGTESGFSPSNSTNPLPQDVEVCYILLDTWPYRSVSEWGW